MYFAVCVYVASVQAWKAVQKNKRHSSSDRFVISVGGHVHKQSISTFRTLFFLHADIPDPEENVADELDSGESSEDDVGGTISKYTGLLAYVTVQFFLGRTLGTFPCADVSLASE